MEQTTFQTLSTLTPAVAVTVILALLVYKSNEQAALMHKEKTIAFLEHLKAKDAQMQQIADSNNEIARKTADAVDSLKSAVDMNTAATSRLLNKLDK